MLSEILNGLVFTAGSCGNFNSGQPNPKLPGPHRCSGSKMATTSSYKMAATASYSIHGNSEIFFRGKGAFVPFPREKASAPRMGLVWGFAGYFARRYWSSPVLGVGSGASPMVRAHAFAMGRFQPPLYALGYGPDQLASPFRHRIGLHPEAQCLMVLPLCGRYLLTACCRCALWQIYDTPSWHQ